MCSFCELLWPGCSNRAGSTAEMFLYFAAPMHPTNVLFGYVCLIAFVGMDMQAAARSEVNCWNTQSILVPVCVREAT